MKNSTLMWGGGVLQDCKHLDSTNRVQLINKQLSLRWDVLWLSSLSGDHRSIFIIKFYTGSWQSNVNAPFAVYAIYNVTMYCAS